MAGVLLQVSLGGLLVSLVMKYADNVVKGFATSLSIVLSSLASAFIPAFDFQPTAYFVAGSTLVILATILYSSPSPGGAAASTAHAHKAEVFGCEAAAPRLMRAERGSSCRWATNSRAAAGKEDYV